jgi:hypothetical protein
VLLLIAFWNRICIVVQSCFGLFVRICGILLLCHTKLDFISSAFGIVRYTCEFNLLRDLQSLLLLLCVNFGVIWMCCLCFIKLLLFWPLDL